MSSPVEAKASYEKTEMKVRIEYDPKVFPPCVAKETEIWQWKPPKTIRYIVHVDLWGNITRRRLD